MTLQSVERFHDSVQRTLWEAGPTLGRLALGDKAVDVTVCYSTTIFPVLCGAIGSL